MVVDLQAAFGQLGNKPAYGEIAFLDPLRQPDSMLSRNRLRFVTTHLARSDAPGLIDPPHPADGRADRHPKPLGGLIAGHPALDERATPPESRRRWTRSGASPLER